VPHYNRQALAAMLGLSLDRIHLHEGHVGGGFGIRGELYPEDVLTCAAALRLGRPVKWIEDRYEHLVAANQSRGSVHRVRAAVDEHGFILGLDDEFWFDQGGYLRTHGVVVTDLTCAMLPGPYIIPAYRSVGHVRLTNKTPCGTYRAPGRFEASFVRERLVDVIADRLGLDPIVVRRRNFIAEAAMPFRREFSALGTDIVYDTGDYAGLLDKFLNRVEWETLRADVVRRGQAGEMVGLGLGFFVEKSGLGPFDDVRITLGGDGTIEVITGAASIGQGVETVLAQICADGFGTGLDRIQIIHGQTSMLVEGQIVGGAAQGIGASLLEEFVYDASGQPQSVTLADYLMPTIAEIPTNEVSLFEDAPTPLNPLGVKGAGEAGIAAAGAAIAAAVDDALGRTGAVRQLPITPNRLHALLAELPAAER
jgi:carbon-monoxide dehydrogenase large subunit